MEKLHTMNENIKCGGIGIRFWTWYGGITFMRALNTKTAEEINKNLSKMGLNPVL